MYRMRGGAALTSGTALAATGFEVWAWVLLGVAAIVLGIAVLRAAAMRK